ncbi:MAG: MGH1-like glycoside hydrolase domain-containing protein [Devosia sp.]
MTLQTEQIYDHALEVLKENDQGGYTIPTKGLYPFQWNWDSCLTALGQFHYDEARAWTEIETLLANQWDDGMVPHIVFHVYSDGYFPGPDVWQTNRPTPTSGITQPPVAAFAVKRLYDRATDKAKAAERARALLPKLDRWHRWFYEMRDPAGEGLVAILHPWESGRDNSIDWDDAFERVPTEGVEPYVRRDTQHADPAHRPTKEQYDRYLYLVQLFRSLGWDNSRLHDASPFKVVDPGFNAILIRSMTDLADLAEALGETAIAQANRERAAKALAALESLWSERHGQYLCRDRVTGQLIESASIGGILPVFAAVPKARAQAIARTIERWATQVKYIVPSHDPSDPRFEPKRYWRAPAWLVMNYMIQDGLRAVGETAVADHIVKSSLELITQSGFAEYYDPLTGEPCGGGRFTWTAAMVIEFLEAA